MAPKVSVCKDRSAASLDVAGRVARLLEAKRALRQSVTLGLPTGDTPVGVYEELARRHREEGLACDHLRAFGLDEYWPMAPEHPQSFTRFLRERVAGPLELPAGALRVPDGTCPEERVTEHCAEVEIALGRSGGLDLLLLGIGVNGHLAFNEPGSPPDAPTRLVDLAESTRARVAEQHAGEEPPRRGITLGLGTLLDARRIIVMAFGTEKTEAVQRALRGPVSEEVPASFLQRHPQVSWVLDEAAAG